MYYYKSQPTVVYYSFTTDCFDKLEKWLQLNGSYGLYPIWQTVTRENTECFKILF